MADNIRRKESIEKIDQQILRAEEITNNLLEDLDMSEITAVDRLNIAVKFMALQSRLISMKNAVELDEPEKQGLTILAAFQRHLRGENVIEE